MNLGEGDNITGIFVNIDNIFRKMLSDKRKMLSASSAFCFLVGLRGICLKSATLQEFFVNIESIFGEMLSTSAAASASQDPASKTFTCKPRRKILAQDLSNLYVWQLLKNNPPI